MLSNIVKCKAWRCHNTHSPVKTTGWISFHSSFTSSCNVHPCRIFEKLSDCVTATD